MLETATLVPPLVTVKSDGGTKFVFKKLTSV